MKEMLIFFLIFLSSCQKVSKTKMYSSKEDVELKPSYGDAYVSALLGDATYLNPVLATDSASAAINGLVYNGLVKYDKDINIVGDLAESWKIRNGGLEIIFKLRKNVYWHDGKPFTSADVKFTYEKLKDPEVKTPYSADYMLVKKVTTPDPYTVHIFYKKPFAPALESWGIGIIPKHIFDGSQNFNSHPANRKPIGTGPYKFTEWKTDEKIVLDYYSDYFEGRDSEGLRRGRRLYPYIDRCIYRIIPDQAVQFLELRNGSLDSIGLSPDQYFAYDEFFAEYNKFKYPSFSYTYLGYNLRNPLFRSKRVRQAIAHAINKNDIINGVLLGLGYPATGPFPPSSWAYNPNVRDYEYAPEKAKKLLKEEGWEDVDGDGILEKRENGKLLKFKFVILTNQGNKSRELCAQIIQHNLKKIGIRVDIRIIEWSSFIQNFIRPRNFDAVILGWSLLRDPDQYLIWHSSQIGEDKYNFVSYINPKVDKLLEKGREVFNREERRKIYWEIHRILHEDQPYCFLYYPEALVVVHKRFIGPQVAPLGLGWNFVYWYVPEKLQRYKITM